MTDTRKTLSRQSLALNRFAKDLLMVPFGSLAKSESQYLIFRLLLESGELDDALDDFAIANQLGITPTRVRSLRYRLDQARVSSGESPLVELLRMEGFLIEEIPDSDKVRVEFTRQYVREHFLAVLRARRVVGNRTLSADVIEVDAFKFFSAIFDELSADDADVRAGLIDDETIERARADLASVRSDKKKSERLAAAERLMSTLAANELGAVLRNALPIIPKLVEMG